MNKHPQFIKLRFSLKKVFNAMALVFVGLLFTASLSSCGTPSVPSNKTILRFSFWGAGQELSEIKTIIADYEVAHPNIDIVPLHVPENYFQKLHILAAGDLTPDVMMLNSLYLPVYADNDILLPLDSYVSKTIQADYFKQTLTALSWHKKLYALPRDVSDLVVYYNLDLLKANGLAAPRPQWTMAEFTKMAKAVCEPPSKKHPAGVFGVTFFDKPLFWLPWVWSYGGELFDVNFEKVLLNKPETIEGLQAYRDLIWKDKIAPNKRQVGLQAMSQLFADGHIAFFISGRWSVPYLRDSAQFQWDVAPFPQGPKGSVMGIDASGYGVAKKTTHPEEAVAFVKYLTSATALKRLTASGLIVPARQDLAHSDVFLKQLGLPRNHRVFIDIISSGKPTHTPKRWDEVSEELGLGLEPVWDGRKLPQAVAPQITTTVEALLKD